MQNESGSEMTWDMQNESGSAITAACRMSQAVQ